MSDWPNPELIAEELRSREASERRIKYGCAPVSEWPEQRPEPKRHYGKRKSDAE